MVLIPFEDDGQSSHHQAVPEAPLDRRESGNFPQGRLNPGESPDDAARRECEEEIGRVPHRVERIRGLYPAPGFCDEELIFFRISDLRQPQADSPNKPDEDEDIASRTVEVGEARSMLERGEIIDLKTAYALSLI